MTSPPAGRAPQPSWPEFGRRLAAGAIPLLPFGAYEQHGPHLPLDTDTLMANELTRRICGCVDAVALPAVGYGRTDLNDGFPGTLSLSFDTVRAIATDLTLAVHGHGARGLVIVNGDYGNRDPLALVARESMQRLGFQVLVVNYPGMAESFRQVCTSQPAGFGLHHADEWETSIVLAIDPDAVAMDRAAAGYPEFPATFPQQEVPLHQLSASGVFGDPTAADADKGRALLDLLTDAASTVVRDFIDGLPAAGPGRMPTGPDAPGRSADEAAR